MTTSPRPSVMKQAGMQITAGGSAGFIEVCLMHPLDVVKTRLQLQVKKPIGGANTVWLSFSYFGKRFGVKGFLFLTIRKVYYNGVFDCFSKIARQEGVFAVYKGIIPPILAETPKRATKFVCFEQYKTCLQKALGSEKATPLVRENYKFISWNITNANVSPFKDLFVGRIWFGCYRRSAGGNFKIFLNQVKNQISLQHSLWIHLKL